jgi:hypothetical protein
MKPNRKQSLVVQRAVQTFYAVLATAAAKMAVSKINENNIPEAKKLAFQVEEWLTTAGAQATDWRFRQPNV